MTMAKHETKTGTTFRSLVRDWRDIDPKVIAGLASSITVSAIITAGAAVGVAVPNWVAFVIVIAVTFGASYLTKSRVQIADDSGLTAQQAAIAAHVAAAGDALGDEDLQAAAREAFAAAGIALDDDGLVVDTSHPLVADKAPDENQLAP
jgi:hypothetical protein